MSAGPASLAYTTESLGPADPRFVARSPGLRELLRLFPDPSSVGRGALGVEGGISLVAGAGMGKRSLLARLGRALLDERGIPSATVRISASSAGITDAPFHRVLGQIAAAARHGLLACPLLDDLDHGALRAQLGEEPEWDGEVEPPALTPRGLERWIARLGAAAIPSGGVCLLFEDVDLAASVPWKDAFVATLRFVFQASSGVTPVYAVWRLFLDESMPGSNYFRNITRPFFLEPLKFDPAGLGSEREELARLGLPDLPRPWMLEVFARVGGHPRLLHQVLADLVAATPGAASDAGPPFDAEAEARHRASVAELMAGTPRLERALAEIHRAGDDQRYRFDALPRAVLASGLVDGPSPQGLVRLPRYVTEVLAPQKR